MYAPTANGTASRRARAQPQDHREQPERRDELAEQLRPARARTCRDSGEERLIEHGVGDRDAGERPGDLGHDVAPARPATAASPCHGVGERDAGLKCAPEIGPNARMSATSAAPVASVFASSASATFPPASRSPMMPEPTTAASSIAVPTASATARRRKSGEAATGVSRDDVGPPPGAWTDVTRGSAWRPNRAAASQWRRGSAGRPPAAPPRCPSPPPGPRSSSAVDGPRSERPGSARPRRRTP